jgi:hypothetical protein
MRMKIAVLLMCAATARAEEPLKIHRNLFEFVEQAPPPAKRVVKARPVVVPVIAPVVSAPVVAVAQKPAPPPFPYRIIGRFGPDANPFAVVDAGGNILNVRVGDVIDDKFRIAMIGFESATLAVQGTEQRIAIGP